MSDPVRFVRAIALSTTLLVPACGDGDPPTSTPDAPDAPSDARAGQNQDGGAVDAALSEAGAEAGADAGADAAADAPSEGGGGIAGPVAPPELPIGFA